MTINEYRLFYKKIEKYIILQEIIEKLHVDFCLNYIQLLDIFTPLYEAIDKDE